MTAIEIVEREMSYYGESFQHFIQKHCIPSTEPMTWRDFHDLFGVWYIANYQDEPPHQVILTKLLCNLGLDIDTIPPLDTPIPLHCSFKPTEEQWYRYANDCFDGNCPEEENSLNSEEITYGELMGWL